MFGKLEGYQSNTGEKFWIYDKLENQIICTYDFKAHKITKMEEKHPEWAKPAEGDQIFNLLPVAGDHKLMAGDYYFSAKYGRHDKFNGQLELRRVLGKTMLTWRNPGWGEEMGNPNNPLTFSFILPTERANAFWGAIGQAAILDLTNIGEHNEEKPCAGFEFEVRDQSNKFYVFDLDISNSDSSDLPPRYQKLVEAVHDLGDYTWPIFQSWQEHVKKYYDRN